MRNLKKLLAVIVAICTLVTLTIPAFAADTATTTAAPAAKTEAQICTDLGVVLGSGSGVTADYLASQPDRLQGAIMFLRLKGLESAAKAFTGTDNFADVAGLNETNQAILAYLKANPDLGFGGIGDNKFSATTKMSAKEYYKVLLVALGYTYGTDATADFTWNSVFAFSASKGLTKLIDNEKFTVNDLAIGTVEALKTAVKGDTDTLIATLVANSSITADKATASGLYAPVAKAFEVVSATTDNLKTVKFEFNKEIDSDTVIVGNFNYNNTNVKDVKLLDDKKTVLVILKDAKKMSETEEITVKNVTATDGTKVADTKKKITFVDTTVPVISGAVAKNAKAIVITASEPINEINDYVKVFSDIKIDGSSVIATSTFDYVKNTLTLNLASLMTKGAHKIEIASLKDYAAYTAVATSFNLDVAEDTTAPSITSAEVVNNSQIKVTFNEDVDQLNQGSFKVNDTDVSKATQGDDRAVFTLDLGKTLDIGATVEIRVKYKDQKDVNGNKTAETTYTFKVADDTTLPTVSASIDSSNKIKLTFSKAMLTTVGTLKIYKVSDGLQLGGNISLAASSIVKWNDAKTEATIDANAASIGLDKTDSKALKLVVSDAKDASIRMNAMPEATMNVTAGDTNTPSVQGSYTLTANGTATDDDTITFYFSEAMDSATLQNLSNYVVVTANGLGYTGPLSGFKSAAGNTASVSSIASDNKSITLKVDGIYNATPAFQVYAIKDVAGNMMAANNNVTVASPVGPIITKAEAVAGNKIEVTFDQNIGTFAPGAFILNQDGTKTGTFTAAVYAGSIDNTKNMVTLTLDRDLGTTTANAILYVNDATLCKNVYGTALTGAAVAVGKAIDDKIKPTVTAASSGAGIVVTFSEDVTVTTTDAIIAEIGLTKDGATTSVTSGMLTYKDKDFNTVATGLNATVRKVLITLPANTTYKILFYPRYTKDLHGNDATYMAETSVTTGN